MMKYKSTRGQENISFVEALLAGYASDGGMILPERIPKLDSEQLAQWSHLNFLDLCTAICSLFIDETEISREELAQVVKESFKVFEEDTKGQIVPILDVGGLFLAELFYGPTLAFKDLALQFVGQLLQHVIDNREKLRERLSIFIPEFLTILISTSGDTGSAAIEAVRGKKGIDIVVLYPGKGRISMIQEMQMASVNEPNVHVLAMDGTSDDCDVPFKKMFEDLEFKKKYGINSINSVNWARIMVQIVYYFYCYFHVVKVRSREDWPTVRFAVPSGGFGNCVAGYIAKQMGLPIELMACVNENDTLHTFFKTGVFKRKVNTVVTLAPSMDIGLPYNFERYLYLTCGQDAKKVAAWMATLDKEGEITPFPEEEYNAAGLKNPKDFMQSTLSTASDISSTIAKFQSSYNYLLDPHSAVAVHGSLTLPHPDVIDTCCLLTAHPAKFHEAVTAATGVKPPVPSVLVGLEDKPKLSRDVGRDEDWFTVVRDLVVKIHSK